MNKNEYIANLIQKYLHKEATPEEIRLLYQYYDLFDETLAITELLSEEELATKENKGLQQIHQQIQQQQQFHSTTWLMWLTRIAATITIIWGIYYLSTPSPLSAADVLVEGKETVNYNRFLVLPDGTTVILHGNSQLTYDDTFNYSNREVTLLGEAFFDVPHDAQKPFIIYTGKVKTTVLGTAFNIQAWPDQKQIIVSVARGSVKVEDEKQGQIVLAKNNQVVYNTEFQYLTHTIEPIDSSMNWLQTNMTFDNMPFNKLVDHLSQRYGVEFSFEDNRLKDCPFTGRFTGTENLEEILNILAEISGTQYQINNDHVLIQGNDCL